MLHLEVEDDGRGIGEDHKAGWGRTLCVSVPKSWEAGAP